MATAGSRPSSSERMMRIIATVSTTFWILILATVALFAFFLAVGAFKAGEVAGLTIAVGVLAAMWVAHAMWEARHRVGRDPDAIRARERRGF